MRPIAARFTEVLNFRVLMVLAILAGVLAMQAGRGTLAYFTSTATSTGNTFVAGSIELDLTDSNQTLLDSVAASITANVATNSWRPGQVVTAPITVTNSGTLGMTYGLAYTASDSGTTPDGASATPTQFLTLAVRAKGTGAGVAADCTTAKFTDNSFWQESVVAATALSTAGATLLADTSRTLGADGTATDEEVLCMQVVFTNGAAGVENAAMGGTSTLVLNFNGRQL